jgi:hypothetical protein
LRFFQKRQFIRLHSAGVAGAMPKIVASSGAGTTASPRAICGLSNIAATTKAAAEIPRERMADTPNIHIS